MNKMKKFKYEKYEYSDEWKIMNWYDYLAEWRNRIAKEFEKSVNQHILSSIVTSGSDFTPITVPLYMSTVPNQMVNANMYINNN